jgi:hypothetical protein
MSATSAYADPLYSASMPRSLEPNPVQSPESPKPRSFLLVADQTWPVVFETHSPVTNIVSSVRPTMLVAIVVSGDSELALLRTALLGGTVNLLLAEGGRTVTMQKPTIDSMKYIDREFPDFPVIDGRRIAVLSLSADSRFYRST